PRQPSRLPSATTLFPYTTLFRSESKRDTALGLMSIHRNKPYHLPDTMKSNEELQEVYNEIINTDRVVMYDHFGSNDIDIILAKIDRKSTRLNSSHVKISYAVFCL